MQVPGTGEVIELLRGGVVRTGEVDVATGSWVRMGQALGVVMAVGPDGADVAVLDGQPREGDTVTEVPDPGVVVGPGVAGRVLDALGRPLDGGPVPDGPRRHRSTGKVWTTRRPTRRWLPTGLLGLDALAPVPTAAATLLSCPSAAAAHEALLTVLAMPRAETTVLVLPAVSAAVLDRLRARLTALPSDRLTVVAASVDDPPMARLKALEAGVHIATAARDDGLDVLLLVDGLHLAADAVAALAGPLRQARGPFGWPVRTSEIVAALTDATGGGPGALTVLATAVVDRPGLTDHLDPWFDRVVPHDAPPGPGMLPRPRPADLPPGPLGTGLQPDALAADGQRLRDQLRADAAAAELSHILADPDRRQAAAAARLRLAALDQRAGQPVGPEGIAARVQAALSA